MMTVILLTKIWWQFSVNDIIYLDLNFRMLDPDALCWVLHKFLLLHNWHFDDQFLDLDLIWNIII